ncbi:hypothetical protein NDU88_004873 [Pleurodeles waltl]|uniref:Uncharacterized protein n=1 Tax=Pleurodeles waltl TaxID=8319 RepID=A0AAV7LJE6_PLEWA|nr:hypothetical protein NDU88_004873 [Pleurodeles waltl]
MLREHGLALHRVKCKFLKRDICFLGTSSQTKASAQTLLNCEGDDPPSDGFQSDPEVAALSRESLILDRRTLRDSVITGSGCGQSTEED